MKWLRLYHEMLHDPKIGTLTHSQFHAWINLLMLAGAYCGGGSTGHTRKTVAFASHWPAADMEEELSELMERGLIEESEDRQLVVTKWKKWQMDDYSGDRVRKLRVGRRTDATPCNGDAVTSPPCNGDAFKVTEVTVEEKRREKGFLSISRNGISFDVPDWVPVLEWDAWEQHLESKRGKPFSDHARQLAIDRISELRDQGYDPKSVINQAIRRDWNDLFEIKSTLNDNKGPNNGKQNQQQSGRKKSAVDLVQEKMREKYGDHGPGTGMFDNDSSRTIDGEIVPDPTT